MSTLLRNAPCHCGSGKKYKKCCGAQKKLSQRATLVKSTGASPLFFQQLSQFGQNDMARKKGVTSLDSTSSISKISQ